MNDPVQLVLLKLPDAKPAGDAKWTARCPAHEDRRPSLSIARGDDGRALLKCHAGCSTDDILAALGLEMKSLFPLTDDRTPKCPRIKGAVSARAEKNRQPSQNFPTCATAVDELERTHGSRAAAWTYHDANGNPVGLIVRWNRPDGTKDIRPISRHGGGWCIGAMPDPRPLYALAELAVAERVVVCEGELAAGAARSIGFAATTSAGGSQAASMTDWRPLAGKQVWILPDNDSPGQKYAEAVASILSALPCPATVRIVELPDLPEKGDVVDYIEAARAAGLDDTAIRANIETLANEQPVAGGSAATAEDVGKNAVDDAAEIDLDDGDKFPDSLHDAAYQGLVGDIVRAIEPHTETSSVAILIQILVAFGSIIGRGPYFMVEGTRHHCNLFAVIVGQSSKSRKGTSWDRIRQVCHEAELQKKFLQPWVSTCIASGSSSGEGIIHAIRDSNGADDEGIADKRLLVQESEFAKVLKSIERQGNTLSAVLRDAWDGHTLRTLTRSNAIKATNPHVSVVGHITANELCKMLDATESVNGFANRFLFALAKRSKYLPEGGGQFDLAAIAKGLGDAVSFAREVGEMRRDDGARARWREIYPELSDGFPGLAGTICGRAEAQVLRLSLVYALMDQSYLVCIEHLEAALALWRYCENSARCIFGQVSGDEIADRIASFLRAAGPNGMTQTEIVKALGGHHKKPRLERAFKMLLEARKVRHVETPSGGRKRRTWYWNVDGAPKEAK